VVALISSVAPPSAAPAAMPATRAITNQDQSAQAATAPAAFAGSESDRDLREIHDIIIDKTQSGTYVELLQARLVQFLYTIHVLLAMAPTILGMFLMGMVLARQRVLLEPQNHTRLLSRLAVAGILFGLTMTAIPLWYWATYGETVNVILFVNLMLANAGGVLLAMGYIGLFLRMWVVDWTRPVLQMLAPVGRMPLTNYLLQSFICTTLFYSYGFAMFGKVGPLQMCLLAIAIFVVQMMISAIWMRFFVMGPFEWLWRYLTDFKRRQFLRTAESA
jgi:uncharacterized protein